MIKILIRLIEMTSRILGKIFNKSKDSVKVKEVPKDNYPLY